MKFGLIFGTFAAGGAERMMINLGKGLKDQGHEISFYVVNKTGPYLSHVPKNIKIHDFKSKNGVKFCIPQIRNVFQQDNLDVLISTQEHINAVVSACYASVQTKTKLILREANTPSVKVNSFFKKRLYRKLYKYADHFIAVSEGVKNDMINFYKLKNDRVTVIYNPVIDHDINGLVNEEVTHSWFQEDSKVPVIVGMGRFQPQKRFENLIEAFTLFRNKQNARLVIFGDYERNPGYTKTVKEKIRNTGLEESIDLPGYVDNPFKFLSKASVFVLSSDFEGLPGVLIQALACGCPVISTDCPSGPREILENGKYGMLVPVNDPSSLADAIEKTLENPISADILKKRASFFSVQNSVRELENLVQRLN